MNGIGLFFREEIMVVKKKYEIAPGFEKLEGWIKNIKENFSAGGETIFKVRNEVKVFEVDGIRLNVKSYKLPNLINRYAYVYLRGSKAKRSFQYASRLEQLGVPTPQPIAYIEYREGGALRESYYVSLQFDYDYTLREVLEQKNNEKEILKEWVKFTYEKLHKNGVFHLDYSPGNTLLKKTSSGHEFSLIDLNRMDFIEIDYKKGLQNLCQLALDKENLDLVAAEYAKLQGQNQEEAKARLFNIVEKHEADRAKRVRFKNKMKRMFGN